MFSKKTSQTRPTMSNIPPTVFMIIIMSMTMIAVGMYGLTNVGIETIPYMSFLDPILEAMANPPSEYCPELGRAKSIAAFYAQDPC